MTRLVAAVAIEVLIYPAMILVLVAMYALGLPGLEIVTGLLAIAIIVGIMRGLWMLPRKLRMIWSKTHG